MAKGDFLFTSESVTEGHSDKLADQISDAFLDAALTQDKKCRVACETFVTAGLVMVGGEVTTTGYVDIDALVRGVIKDAGYIDRSLGFTFDTCAILNAIGKQAPDIAQGVDRGGAGDQGLMTGFACRETGELMPMPIMLAHGLTRRLAEVRIKGVLPYLRPDGKSQVTVEYRDGRPARVEAVVISAQHTEDILDRTGRQITSAARDEMIEKIAFEVIPRDMIDKKTKFFVNPTGKFVTGGPRSDVGLTGRKIIVDTYGGMASHGGGAFSGKDATKVDRSASYMTRYIAKNVVASGLADKCTIQVAYAIGVAKPVSLMIFCDGTHKVPEKRIVELIKKHFDLTPRGIIKTLDLTRPIFRKTATYGHFGRDGREFTWERTDVAKTLAKDA